MNNFAVLCILTEKIIIFKTLVKEPGFANFSLNSWEYQKNLLWERGT